MTVFCFMGTMLPHCNTRTYNDLSLNDNVFYFMDTVLSKCDIRIYKTMLFASWKQCCLSAVAGCLLYRYILYILLPHFNIRTSVTMDFALLIHCCLTVI